jgi:hypothetical protein
VYLKNNGSVSYDIDFWVQTSAPNGSPILVGLEDSTGQAQSTGGITNAPGNVTFSSPTAGVPLEVTLAASAYIGVWLKRTVPVRNTISVAEAVFELVAKAT